MEAGVNGEAQKQAIHKRLLKLATKGALTPDVVVQDAQKATSPLHHVFEWDDAVAGVKYRIAQARHLIASHRVFIERRETVIAAPAYVRDPSVSARDQGYISTARLSTDKDLARSALVSEAARAAAYLERVRALAVALDLEDEVDEILASFDGFRSRVGLAIEELEMVDG